MNAHDWTCYSPQRIPNSEILDIRGLACHLQRWPGQGGPLCILLHGWMDAGATFQFLVDALPPSWEVIAPDWRGYGQSAWSPGGYYFPEYLADLDALLNVLSPEIPVWLVGHSMGGNVASLYAGIRPERVSRLVSLEGLGLPPSQASQAPQIIKPGCGSRPRPEKTVPMRTGHPSWSACIKPIPVCRRNASPSLPMHGPRTMPKVPCCGRTPGTSYAARCVSPGRGAGLLAPYPGPDTVGAGRAFAFRAIEPCPAG